MLSAADRERKGRRLLDALRREVTEVYEEVVLDREHELARSAPRRRSARHGGMTDWFWSMLHDARIDVALARRMAP